MFEIRFSDMSEKWESYIQDCGLKSTDWAESLILSKIEKSNWKKRQKKQRRLFQEKKALYTSPLEYGFIKKYL
jgi:hypothetical protein